MSLNPSLRRLDDTEADILAAIHEECFPRYWNREAFIDFFAVENTFAWLAEIDGVPAAMMVYRQVHEQADILTLAVRPAYRRHGLAKRLLDDALAHCRALGADTMLLEVEDGNAPALTLYEQAGFTLVSRRKLYYLQSDGSLTDALVMRRKL